MVRLVAFLTIATVGGLLFAMLGEPEGADAHSAAAKPSTVVQQAEKAAVAAPPLGSRPSSSVSDDKPPAPKVSSVSAASAVVQSKGNQRSFLMRPTGSLGGDLPQQSTREQETGRTSTDQSKPHVERAPTPAVIETKNGSEKPLLRLASKSEPKLLERASPAREKFALDLNRETAAELDELSGGRIGKAIVRGRPYTTPDDLIRKRILTKEAFARIKDRVAVR